MNRFVQFLIFISLILSLLGGYFIFLTLQSNSRYQSDWNTLKTEKPGKNFTSFLTFGLPPGAIEFFNQRIDANTALTGSRTFQIRGKFLHQKRWRQYEGEMIIHPLKGYLKRMVLPNGIAEEYFHGDKAYRRFRVFGVFESSFARDTDIHKNNFLRLLLYSLLAPAGFLLEKNIDWQKIDSQKILYRSSDKTYVLELAEDEIFAYQQGQKEQAYSIRIEKIEKINGYQIPTSLSLFQKVGQQKIEQLIIEKEH